MLTPAKHNEVIVEKLTFLDIDPQTGAVIKEETESGIVLVSTEREGKQKIDSHTCQIKTMSKMTGWTYWYNKKRETIKVDWEDVGIKENVIINVVRGAGLMTGQILDGETLNLKHHEIMCVGKSLDDDSWPAAKPTPGYLLVEVDFNGENKDVSRGGIVLANEMSANFLSGIGEVVKAVVVEVPKVETKHKFEVNDIVYLPIYPGRGMSEQLRFSDTLWCIRADDIVAVNKNDV